jgi:hypothetical protein
MSELTAGYRWIYCLDRARHVVRDVNLPTMTLCGQTVGTHAGLVPDPERYRPCVPCMTATLKKKKRASDRR